MKLIKKYRCFLIKLLVAAGLASLVWACGSSKPACLGPKMQRLEISWGDVNVKTNEISGYLLKTDRNIFEVKNENSGKYKIGNKAGKVDSDTYCRIMHLTRKKMLTAQTLNVPSETSRFVHYKNPDTKTDLRVIWNKNHENAGNKEFRALYDSLSTVLNSLK